MNTNEPPAVCISVVVISKDEPALDETLSALSHQHCPVDFEVVVVDASRGRLESIQRRHPTCRWIDFAPQSAKRITIPEQRNAGVQAALGEIVVFIDAGCIPAPGWLALLTEPIRSGAEQVTVGRTTNRGAGAVYQPLSDQPAGAECDQPATAEYLSEAPTINLAFTIDSYQLVGGFDESFDYGSDIDFTWRLHDAGYKLRFLPQAELSHDWGTKRRQLKRSYVYGRARARLYHKHLKTRLRSGLRNDPILFVYPVFLLFLPLTVLRGLRAYPLLLLIPIWRARHSRPLLTIADHLVYGIGALSYLADQLRGAD